MEMTGQSQPCQTHGNDRIPSRSFSHSFSSIDQPMRLHVAIAYRRLSALGRDKLVVTQLHHLVTCLLASLIHHQHLTNTSAPLLPSFLLSTFHSYPRTTPATSIPTTEPPLRLPPASDLAQSGAFTDVLYSQSPKQTAIGIRESHSPTTEPTPTRHSTTRQSSSQLPRVATSSRNIIPKHYSDHWSQNPATA
jgi:hypothetical protein